MHYTLRESKWPDNLQLSISMTQCCLSMGKYCRFIGHDAVMVSLWTAAEEHETG